jgi:hypothetical protein
MNKFKKNNGQIMLMSVLLICGAILGVSALASTLVLQQIKRSTAAGESARSVFAADAGIERVLWERYRDDNGVLSACATGGTFPSGGFMFEAELSEESGKSIRYKAIIKSCSSGSSLGESGRSARAFGVGFNLCEWGQIDASLCATEPPPTP